MQISRLGTFMMIHADRGPQKFHKRIMRPLFRYYKRQEPAITGCDRDSTYLDENYANSPIN
jgi:hypothetical protein